MKVCVIGDVITDRYIYGTAERLSPEAPVPIVKQTSIVEKSGGAGNLYENLRSLGVVCDLLAPPGKHSVKTRVFCDDHYVTRIDDDHRADGKAVLNKALTTDFTSYDFVVLSDYNKGALEYSREIISHVNKFGCRVIVDPKSEHTNYSGAWLVKPNASEYYKFGFDCWEGNIIITKAKEPTSARFEGRWLETHVNVVDVADVTGAGDCFLAAFVYGLSKEYGYSKSLEIATAAASLSVTKTGTYVLKPGDIKHRTIFTNGCFDILHRGHIEYLQQSRALGARLVVGLNSDQSVKRLKGSSRPINNQEDRKHALLALACVDEVIIFDQDTPYDLIKEVAPDVITKGGDYRPEDVVGNDLADVVILPFVKDYSTTNIVEKVNATRR